MTNSPTQWKRGDIHPETGLLFWRYYMVAARRTKEKRTRYSEYWVNENKYNELLNNKRCEDRDKKYTEKSFHNAKERTRKNVEKNKKNNPMLLLYRCMVNNSRSRSIYVDIKKEDIENLWEDQQGKCYYTGIDMLYTYGANSPYQVSIDRVDSNKAYTLDNIVLCCQAINLAKRNYPVEIFTQFITKIKNTNNE